MITAVAPDADIRQHYAEHGVVNIAGVLDPAEVDVIRAAFMAQVDADRSTVGFDDHVPDDDNGGLRLVPGTHRYDLRLSGLEGERVGGDASIPNRRTLST